ncbi:hypothetical protein D048_3427 [Vibrio parahaemolyticus VPTS-2009]|nr:hypothetical protein D048_3427 [Vibrio parahaemolyticus VPTS-2009]
MLMSSMSRQASGSQLHNRSNKKAALNKAAFDVVKVQL